MNKKNILLIGFGPHAKRIYYPISKRDGNSYKFKIVYAVDLVQKKKDIECYLEEQGDNNFPVYYLLNENETIGHLSPEVMEKLNSIVDQHQISGVIISTEPRVHMQYARWALKKGLSLLMDKPISIYDNISTDPVLPQILIQDYHELMALYQKVKNTNKAIVCSLMAQRRFHPAYKKVKALIQEVHKETNCPITSIQSFHGDGQWRFPHEIVDIDYHGYNQGYGKSAHSGYHFYDIISWFLDAGESKEKTIDNVDIFTNVIRPSDFTQQLTQFDYEKLFPDSPPKNYFPGEKFNTFGEIDSFSSFAFKKNDHVLSLGTVNLAHNSYSQRGWASVDGRDLYKGNGRVRHETHMIEQGPFQKISFQSYQSKEVNPQNEIGLYETGGEFHLDIHVFRNSSYNPAWKTYQKYSLEDLSSPQAMVANSRGHQEDARRSAVLEFISALHGNESTLVSELSTHKRSTLLIAGVYQSIANRFSGENPVINSEFTK